MKIKSKKYTDIPGDTRRVMTAPATDETGQAWPRGTVYQPDSAGADAGAEYQTIRIGAQFVTVRR
jgi:hypothetical protein